MNEEHLLSEDKEHLVINEPSENFYSLFILCLMLEVLLLRDFIKSENHDGVLAILVVLIFLTLFLYKILYPNVLFIITRKGLWTKKGGLLQWEKIYYFYIRNVSENSREYHFCFKNVLDDEEKKLVLGKMPYSNLLLIRKKISEFYPDADKIDLGIK